MRLRPVHSRDDLIDIIRGRCRYTSCNRAIDTGIVNVLGGFNPSEGISLEPYWVLMITSRNHRVWYIAVCPSLNTFGVKPIPEVDWLNWVGDECGLPGIYNGDNPREIGTMIRSVHPNKEEL